MSTGVNTGNNNDIGLSTRNMNDGAIDGGELQVVMGQVWCY